MTNSPNELMPPKIDLTGQRFERLVVIAPAPTKGRETFWQCCCDCGAELAVRTSNLRHGRAGSCGCRQRDAVTTHGLCNAPEYKPWASMIERCTKPESPSWPYYGAKGVTVHPTLMTIEGFIAEIGPRPSPEHTIDRIANKGHYEPGNIRWATHVVQCRNRSSNRLITYGGRTLCLAAWEEETGIPQATIAYRLRVGWSVERALSQPVKTRQPPSPASSDFQSGGPVLPLS